MTRLAPALAVWLLGSSLAPPSAMAQAVPMPVPSLATPAPGPRPTGPPASLDIQLVITRLQGQKVISSLPYTLAVTANTVGESQLNMGTEVPVPSTTFAPTLSPPTASGAPPAAPPRPVTSMSYRPVGTVISCRAFGGENGRYEVTLSVDDSAIFTSDQAAPPMPVGTAMPVFRSFKARNTLLLQDGQTRQYTAASDRVSGEVVRVDVTLRVVK